MTTPQTHDEHSRDTQPETGASQTGEWPALPPLGAPDGPGTIHAARRALAVALFGHRGGRH